MSAQSELAEQIVAKLNEAERLSGIGDIPGALQEIAESVGFLAGVLGAVLEQLDTPDHFEGNIGANIAGGYRPEGEKT